MKFILMALGFVVLIYLALGVLPWWFSVFRGDFPGPKQIDSASFRDGKDVDWLLLHGASVDARVWKMVIAKNPNVSMTAISVGNHELGVKSADPGFGSSRDLINYLANHKVVKGIIGHSTASLWIADAYYNNPEYFKNLKIILLAPNFGINIPKSDINNPLFHRYGWLIALLPNPLWNFTDKMSSCIGINKNADRECKELYLDGRLYNMQSLGYYAKLVKYSISSEEAKHWHYLLMHDRKNITIYIAANDHVLLPAITEQLAKKYLINYYIVPEMSHHMLSQDYALWGKEADFFRGGVNEK